MSFEVSGVQNWFVRTRTKAEDMSFEVSGFQNWFVRTRTKAGARYYEEGVKDFLFIKDLRDEF